MTLTIRSETLFAAPNGSPNTRRMVGVGEPVTFTASMPSAWAIPDNPIAGSRVEANVTFNRPGPAVVIATHGSERAEISMNVVAPSVRVRKTADIRADVGRCGALMRLEFTLTPLGVSFQGIEFRERECMADQIWGYFETHRTVYSRLMQHNPRAGDPTGPEWKSVDSQNRVTLEDAAGFSIAAHMLNWPITSGGFRWMIPDEYRVGNFIGRLERPMPQTIRLEPDAGATTAPFRGKIRVNKGGVETEQVYM